MRDDFFNSPNIESFNEKLRDESLNLHLFFTLIDVQEKFARWRKEYNYEKSHSALAGLPQQPSIKHCARI